MYMLRETGSKGESGAAEAVITALFGAADDQQDGTLQENELVTFMRMYKYYCYTFTTTKGPVEGEERLVSDRAFRTEVLDPLMRQVTQNKLPTTTEKHEERGVDEAAITIHRVEHLPETAGEDEQFEAMVVAYQRDFKWKDIDATAYADDDDDDVGIWSAAHRKIGCTESKPVGDIRWERQTWWEALWGVLGWPTSRVWFKRSAEFKCHAPGEVVLKLVDDNWVCDNVVGEATITLEHPSDVGHDGDTRMYRTALRHPLGSKAAEDGFMSAPFWDESGFPWYGDDWAGLVLGADGYPTIIVYSVDESVREDRRRRRRKSRRRRSPSRR